MLTKTAQYAIRSVVHIAQQEERQANGLARIDDIASALDVPRNYLSKVLNALANDGVLRSTRGPRGGFRLAVDPRHLTLARVVGRFEALDGPVRCLIEDRECTDENACVVHDDWEPIATAARGFFARRTIAELLE